MQDVLIDSPEKIEENLGITVQPKDMLSIVVSSRNPELARIFNLPIVTYQAGYDSDNMGQQRLLGYVVDDKGNIDFPILGKIPVKGLTRWQVSEKVKERIMQESLIKDPVVSVQFMNYKVHILGEVMAPGAYNIDNDYVTILEALSMAKDLTIYGRRDSIQVVREIGGSRTIYNLDLRSASLFESPAYYLKQNDVVYVKPNNTRANQSTVNGNNVKSVSVWISVASLIASIIAIVTR